MNAKITEIHNYLVSNIANESFAVNDKLPTEMELAKRFHTNRMNAQLAVKELVGKGIVKRIRRKGSFVCRTIDSKEVSSLDINVANNVHIICFKFEKHMGIHWDETTLASFEKVLSSKGFQGNFHQLPHDNIIENLKKLLNQIDSELCGGIVIFPNSSDVFYEERFDFLMDMQNQIYIFSKGKENLNLPAHILSLDPLREGYEAGKFLKEKGCENVLYLFHKDLSFEKECFLKERYVGLLKALDAHESEIPVMLYDKNNRNDLISLCNKINNSSDKLCIVAGNDSMAADLINSAREMGLTAPDDFNTVSFDNSPEFRMFNLTTVAPQLELVGEIFGRLITDNTWLTQNGCHAQIKIPSKLIVRKTLN
jgi:DNA-binding LacI/PurR family transcriptional regulator